MGEIEGGGRWRKRGDGGKGGIRWNGRTLTEMGEGRERGEVGESDWENVGDMGSDMGVSVSGEIWEWEGEWRHKGRCDGTTRQERHLYFWIYFCGYFGYFCVDIIGYFGESESA